MGGGDEMTDTPSEMTDTPSEEHKRPWFQRASTEWDLRFDNGGKITLVSRRVDEDGLDFDGELVPWMDVAVFSNWADARNVLKILIKD